MLAPGTQGEGKAMRIPVLTAAALALLSFAHPARADIQITVDKAAQVLTVARDGDVLHRWPVSTGRTGRFTPSGNFRAFRMEKDHFSREFDDAPMPHSIFFTQRGHAIHGSFETKKLGRPASGGCVRLAPENARTLFDLVQKEGVLKTTVRIEGDERIAIARANRGLTQNGEQRGTGLPPQYALPEDDPRARQRYAAPRDPSAAQYGRRGYYYDYYDGYEWRAYGGSSYYGANPQPYYDTAPRGYYQRRYGSGWD
jgi:hypothetical protein